MKLEVLNDKFLFADAWYSGQQILSDKKEREISQEFKSCEKFGTEICSNDGVSLTRFRVFLKSGETTTIKEIKEVFADAIAYKIYCSISESHPELLDD